MSIAWGIMALALAGADPQDGPAKGSLTVRLIRTGGDLPVVGRVASNTAVVRAEPEQVSYEVRVVDTPALAWREAFYRHCTRVGREGRSTVWTVDEATVARMLKGQQGAPKANVIQAPKVTAFAGAEATIDTRHPRAFVVDVDRVAEGPVDHAPALMYRPSVEEVREGLAVTVSGKRTAAGVRAHVKLDSTWVGHVIQARTRETIENTAYGKTSVEAGMQLPQVVEAKVEGDYEIQDGRQLLVSLGTATTVDGKNESVVMERLLLIAARPILTEAEEHRVGRSSADAKVRPASADVPAAEPFILHKAYAEVMAAAEGLPAPKPQKMPPLPSRSLLQPVGPDGKVVEVPPLPDEMVAEAEAMEASSGPQASPQARPTRSAPRVDVAAMRAESTAAGRPIALDGRELASGRTQVVRIPIGGSLAIEVQARLVPAVQPE